MDKLRLMIEQSRAVPASPSPPVFEGRALADPFADVDQLKIDHALVDALAREHSKTDLAAGRCVSIIGSSLPVKTALNALFSVDWDTRCRVLQAVTACGPVPAQVDIKYPVRGSEGELRLAQHSNRIKGIRKITSVQLFDALLTLPPGPSGAVVAIDSHLVDGRPQFEFKYGVKGEEPRARVAIDFFDGFVGKSVENMRKFFEELNADGQQVELCAGEPGPDFFVPLFCAAYYMQWNPESRRMTFTARPHAADLHFRLGSRDYSMLCGSTGPFRDIFAKMREAYLRVECAENPVDPLGWLWTHCPIRNVEEAFAKRIEGFRKAFEAVESREIDYLEANLVELFVEASNPDSFIRDRFRAVSLTAALKDLSYYREYRGRLDGPSQPAFLNTMAKDIGVRPLGGILNSVPADVSRLVPILASAASLGVKTASLYGEYRTLPIISYAKQVLGIDVTVFSSLTGVDFVHRNFAQDGFAPTDKADLAIVDVHPSMAAVSGEHTEVTKWRGQRVVLEKNAQDRDVVYLTRVVAKKVGDLYTIDDAFMTSVLRGRHVGVSFEGARAHNGEFILWSFRQHRDTPFHAFEFTKMSDDAGYYWGVVEKAVSMRIVIANHLRTYAIPFGIMNYFRPRREVAVGDGKFVADPVGADLEIFAVRCHPSVRAALSESRTVSTAEQFGIAPLPTINWENAPDMFKKYKNAKKAAAAAPGPARQDFD